MIKSFEIGASQKKISHIWSSSSSITPLLSSLLRSMFLLCLFCFALFSFLFNSLNNPNVHKRAFVPFVAPSSSYSSPSFSIHDPRNNQIAISNPSKRVRETEYSSPPPSLNVFSVHINVCVRFSFRVRVRSCFLYPFSLSLCLLLHTYGSSSYFFSKQNALFTVIKYRAQSAKPILCESLLDGNSAEVDSFPTWEMLMIVRMPSRRSLFSHELNWAWITAGSSRLNIVQSLALESSLHQVPYSLHWWGCLFVRCEKKIVALPCGTQLRCWWWKVSNLLCQRSIIVDMIIILRFGYVNIAVPVGSFIVLLLSGGGDGNCLPERPSASLSRSNDDYRVKRHTNDLLVTLLLTVKERDVLSSVFMPGVCVWTVYCYLNRTQLSKKRMNEGLALRSMSMECYL